MASPSKKDKKSLFGKKKAKEAFGKAAKKKAPISRKYSQSIRKGGFEWALFGPLLAFSIVDGGASALTYVVGGWLGFNAYENLKTDKAKQKIETRKNAAGQRLKGPIWAHEANNSMQRALYYAYSSNEKSKLKYRKKLFSEIQKIEQFLEVVDNAGKPTGDQVTYLKTPPEVVESKTIIPGSEIDSKGKAHKNRRSDGFGV